MKRLGIALVAAGIASLARAADLTTASGSVPPNAGPNCWASLWDVLNTSPSDCPLSYAGFTLYGTIDMGAGYNAAGVPFNNSFPNGVYYGIRRGSDGARFSFFPSALSSSVVGLKMEEQIYGDWLLIGAAEFGFSPMSGMFSNGPRSLTDNNLNTLANQNANGDSSRAGQWDNSQGFVGISNKTYGTLTFGRVNALTTNVISAYDPVRSNAFSLLGFSTGAFAGFGNTQLARVNTGFVYRLEYQNFRVAGLAQVGNGYALGDGSMGEYQGQIGATFGGFSIDGVVSYAKDAVVLATFAGSGLPAGYDPNAILRGTLSNNAGVLVAARYKWDPFEVYAGYTWSRQANPSYGFPGGFPTIALGIFVPAGFVNSTNYNVDRILNGFWVGGKYNVWSNLSASVGFYYQTQNDFLQAPAICAGFSTGISSNKCAGSQSAISGLITYRPFKRVDVYAGMMISNVYGGFAFRHFNSQNIDPGAGIRVRF
jgi:predicted porin